ncbi:hypothetical protein J4E89_001862 [Alternaria sp. Ai002NY15]|nr:hypothetical protein J4E89_001862 [Alternaria sp. Ai002NY15]
MATSFKQQVSHQKKPKASTNASTGKLRSKLKPVYEHNHPMQEPCGEPGRHEDPLPHPTAPKQDLHPTQSPRNGVRGGILPTNLNHINHRRHIHSEKADNSYPLRKGYSAADPRRKWGKAKKPAVKPDVVRQYKNTAPMQLQKWCPKCPAIQEEWVEDVLEPGKKGGKRSHDRQPRPKYVMPAATE